MRFKKKTGLSIRGILVFLCILIMNLLPFTVWAAAPVDAKIPVSCIGKNTNEAFNVILKMESEEFQKADTTVISLKNGETGAFTIHYTCPGTYQYQVYQEKGTDKSTTYDSTVYTVDVYVTEDENGVMHTEPVIYEKGKDEKCADAHFENVKETGKTSHTGIVNTGDKTKLGGYILAMILANGVLYILWWIKLKKGGEC